MKRKFDQSEVKISKLDGSIAKISSMNYPDYAWGCRSRGSQLSIVRGKKCHQYIRFVSTGRSENSFYLQSYGGKFDGYWVFVDESSSELIFAESRSLFKAIVLEFIGDRVLIRIGSDDNRYIRHSNYLLRTDEHSLFDRPWREDTEWLISFVGKHELPTAPPTPDGIREDSIQQFHRPLFIHIQEVSSDPVLRELRLKVLLDCIESSILYSNEVSRISKDPVRVVCYPLQGAGGMGMIASGATAISMLRPGKPVSEMLRRRIEDATTVNSRGGMKSFVDPSDDISEIISDLSSLAVTEMKRMKMFGLVKNRNFDLELGFCEWVTLPEACEILPHRDGGNDCDVAAIVAVSNMAHCTVEGTRFLLEEGQMYIFEPQKYTHSVGTPLFPGPRHVLALRFFKVFYS
jgi:hypothetical protein